MLWTGQECWYKGHLIHVYFDENGKRAGCDYAEEIGESGTVEADLHFLPIPEHIQLATLAWSETGFRDSMLLSDFLKMVLG